MSSTESERKLKEIKTALQVAVISLWAEYPEDFENEFSVKEMQDFGKETATLAKNGHSVEEILYSAIESANALSEHMSDEEIVATASANEEEAETNGQ